MSLLYVDHLPDPDHFSGLDIPEALAEARVSQCHYVFRWDEVPFFLSGTVQSRPRFFWQRGKLLWSQKLVPTERVF